VKAGTVKERQLHIVEMRYDQGRRKRLRREERRRNGKGSRDRGASTGKKRAYEDRMSIEGETLTGKKRDYMEGNDCSELTDDNGGECNSRSNAIGLKRKIKCMVSEDNIKIAGERHGIRSGDDRHRTNDNDCGGSVSGFAWFLRKMKIHRKMAKRKAAAAKRAERMRLRRQRKARKAEACGKRKDRRWTPKEIVDRFFRYPSKEDRGSESRGSGNRIVKRKRLGGGGETGVKT
jgi:hypothetical protein